MHLSVHVAKIHISCNHPLARQCHLNTRCKLNFESTFEKKKKVWRVHTGTLNESFYIPAAPKVSLHRHIFLREEKTETVKTTWLYNRVTNLGLREKTVVACSTCLVGVVWLMLLEAAACATGMLTTVWLMTCKCKSIVHFHSTKSLPQCVSASFSLCNYSFILHSN